MEKEISLLPCIWDEDSRSHSSLPLPLPSLGGKVGDIPVMVDGSTATKAFGMSRLLGFFTQSSVKSSFFHDVNLE